MKRLAVCCLLLGLAIPSQAQPFRHVWRYVSTHKELIAADAVVFAAWSADAASTVNTQRNCPACVETNFFLGPHPSAHALWFTASATASAQITLNHLLWRHAPLPFYRHLVWIPAVVLGATEASNVRGNVQAAQSQK